MRKQSELISVRLKRGNKKDYFEITFPAVMEFGGKGEFLRYKTPEGQTIDTPSYTKCFYYGEIKPTDKEKELIYNMLQDVLPDKFKKI
jgi:hypothetical protein